MYNRSIILALLAPIGLALPQTAAAQTSNAEQACNDFNWLLGTWSSYSPWGDRTDPTGGTLVFTMAGDFVVGHIETTNSYMEENGYTPGMLVFGGFREVRSYGPTGTTRFESFGGEFKQLDNGASRWREESIGVRQNGELYISPVAISALSGHGPFRKTSGTQSGGICATIEAAQPEPAAAPENTLNSTRERLERLIDPRDRPPPILLNPMNEQEEDCLRVQSVRNDVQDLYGRMDLEQALANLESFSRRLADPTREEYLRVADQRNFDRLDTQLRNEMAGLIAAQFLESRPDLVESYSARAVQIAQTYARLAAAEVQRNTLIDDGAAETIFDFASDRDGCGLRSNPILVDYGTNTGTSRSGDPLAPPTEDNLQIQSVRNDVQDLGGQVGLSLEPAMDVESKLANLRSISEHLKSLSEDDPARQTFERNYRRLYFEMEQERNGLDFLGITEEKVSTAEEIESYFERAEQIREGMEGLPAPELTAQDVFDRYYGPQAEGLLGGLQKPGFHQGLDTYTPTDPFLDGLSSDIEVLLESDSVDRLDELEIDPELIEYLRNQPYEESEKTGVLLLNALEQAQYNQALEAGVGPD